MEFFEQITGTYAGQLISTAVIAMLPVIELRGAIPVGLSFGLGYWEAFFASVIGNCIPVPFIVLFIRRVFHWLRSKSSWLENLVSKLERRAGEKAELVRKYELIGLFILVAIPLPGTGAWTGSLVAGMLDLRLKGAFPAISLGVLAAGVIVSIVSYGVISLV